MIKKLKNITKSLYNSLELDNSCISPVFSPTLNLTHGNNDFVFDRSGKKYLDFTSGIAVNAFGHRKEKIYDAISSQTLKLIHTSNLFTTPPQLELCKRLTSMANKALSKTNIITDIQYSSVFLSNSGTEANEAALKFTRATSHRLFRSMNDKVEIISCTNSFHGRTMGALSVTGQKKHQEAFLPLIPKVKFVPFNNSAELKNKINENTAAIIVEPIQGEGGLGIISKDFVETIMHASREHKIFIIADEIQTGLYRTGYLFNSFNVGLIPHIITIAKSLGGGLPLGAVITCKTIHDILLHGDHGSTTGGNPVACSAALATLTKLQSLGTTVQRINSSATLELYIKALCKKFKGCTPLGKGHLRGISLPPDFSVDSIITKARKKGLLILKTGSNNIRIAPSLVCPPLLIHKGMRILQKTISSSQKNITQG